MRYLIAILGLIFVGCDKDDGYNCRHCTVTITKYYPTGQEVQIDDLIDCTGAVYDEDRAYMSGNLPIRKVVRCNPPK
jgi:hypothetical protein